MIIFNCITFFYLLFDLSTFGTYCFNLFKLFHNTLQHYIWFNLSFSQNRFSSIHLTWLKHFKTVFPAGGLSTDWLNLLCCDLQPAWFIVILYLFNHLQLIISLRLTWYLAVNSGPDVFDAFLLARKILRDVIAHRIKLDFKRVLGVWCCQTSRGGASLFIIFWWHFI